MSQTKPEQRGAPRDEDTHTRQASSSGVVRTGRGEPSRGAQDAVVRDLRAARAAEGPPWPIVENYLQTGQNARQVGGWVRRSRDFEQVLRVLSSLEGGAAVPRPASQPAGKAPAWLLAGPGDLGD